MDDVLEEIAKTEQSVIMLLGEFCCLWKRFDTFQVLRPELEQLGMGSRL